MVAKLAKALQGCHVSELENLLDQGEDINCVLDVFGNTALHWTAMDNASLAQVLIERGADLDAKNARGQTPLHQACRHRNVEFVRFLVSKKSTFNINSKDDNGITGLMICAIDRIESILDTLIEAGANVNEVSDCGNSALHHAIVSDFPCSSSLQNLISKADINLRNNLGMTAFQTALENTRIDHAFLLLEQTSLVNLHETDSHGNTLVHKIIRHKRTDCLEKITETSSDLLYIKNTGKCAIALRLSPLLYAVKTHYQEGVQLLLMNDIKEIPVNCHSKGLFVSILKRDESSFETILHRCGNIDKTDSCGRGPLHWAVMAGFLSGVDMLLSKDADVNHRDKSGVSALHLAALKDDEEMAAKLLSYGADTNAKDEDGRTPLHFAALSKEYFCYFYNSVLRYFYNMKTVISTYSHTSTIVLLLRAGCLPDLPDCDGNTPLNLALKCNNSLVVHTLLIWGARTDIADHSGESCHSLSTFSSYQPDHSSSVLCYHIVKIKQANLEMYNSNNFCELESILLNSQVDFKPLFELCEKEMNEIIGFNIGCFVLHDVFTMKTHLFIFDNELKSAIFSSLMKEKFPFYGDMLQAQFMKSELRYERINEAVLFPLSAETKSGDVANIPEEVKRTIFSFLSDEDLVSVIKAV